jgi:uncharacterized protein YcfL
MLNINYKLLPFFALALVGCAADSTDISTPANQDIVISSTGATTTIDQPDGYNLNISGSGNTITISKYNNIKTLTLSGSNNLITFERINSVDTFNVSGSDNSIFASSSSTTSISFTTDSGSGNTLTFQ